ncbi:hypothetical protein ABEB36_009548 [Hypothenemus hampei]|uniref:Uncharacterized protein n=1 Tax=Hypothenemus hampei TaxID=57062 RepID=A0ABD1EH20_HYPHA
MDAAYWAIFSLSIFATVLFFAILLCLAILDCVHGCTRCSLFGIKHNTRISNYPSPGPNDIINSISGRRIQDPIQHYPNSHLPNEHITFTNEQNKFSKSDDGLPSYEEAIKLSMAHSNSLQTYQTELAQTHQQPQSTTATRNNIRMVPGTVLSQTTE